MVCCRILDPFPDLTQDPLARAAHAASVQLRVVDSLRNMPLFEGWKASVGYQGKRQVTNRQRSSPCTPSPSSPPRLCHPVPAAPPFQPATRPYDFWHLALFCRLASRLRCRFRTTQMSGIPVRLMEVQRTSKTSRIEDIASDTVLISPISVRDCTAFMVPLRSSLLATELWSCPMVLKVRLSMLKISSHDLNTLLDRQVSWRGRWQMVLVVPRCTCRRSL